MGRGGRDIIRGFGGRDAIIGNQGNDDLLGGRGNDKIKGNFGNDTLSGGFGRDTLVGGENDDLLSGGDGNDILNGVYSGESEPGKGQLDTLRGGSGADVFALGDRRSVYYADGTSLADYAEIKDFNPDEGDVLRLKGSASDYSLGGSFGSLPDGRAVSFNNGSQRELVAVVQGTTDFTLDSDAVRFV